MVDEIDITDRKGIVTRVHIKPQGTNTFYSVAQSADRSGDARDHGTSNPM
jgi:hypothetical protein